MEIPCRTISDRETSSVFAASSNFLTDSSSNRTRNITALGLFVGRPIFFCPLMLAPPFCSDIYIVANVATYVNRFKITWKTFTISYRAWCWYAGHPPASLLNLCHSRTPSFFFVREKERRGRKKKPYRTIRRGEADAAARGKRCVAAGFRPHKRRGIFLDLMSPQVRPLIITRQQRSAFCQPRLASA